jgi:hypothetical protein
MKDAQDILTFTFNFMVTGGYLAVGLTFLAIAYYIRHTNKVISLVAVSAGFTLILTYASVDLLSRLFPRWFVVYTNVHGKILDVRRGDERVDIAVGNLAAQRPFTRLDYDTDGSSIVTHQSFVALWRDNFNCMTLSVNVEKDNASNNLKKSLCISVFQSVKKIAPWTVKCLSLLLAMQVAML